MTYRFTIPGRLPGLNEVIAANRTNRHLGAKLKADTQRMIGRCIMAQLPGLHITRPVGITYCWIERDRRRDLDNIASAKKFIQDALVEQGVLENDGWKCVRELHDWFHVDKKEPRVTVEIKELV